MANQKYKPTEENKDKTKLSYHGYELKMIQGFKFDEVTSALQKCIRRGKEFDACYWASVIYKSGYSLYLARRLRTIAHEDVGIANPQALILANQLYQDSTYKRTVKKYEEHQLSGDGFLPYANLIILMCRRTRTRLADEITNLIFDGIDKGDLRLEMEDDYCDPHTDKGKLKYGRWDEGTSEDRKRRVKLWFSNWGKLENEASQKEVSNLYKKMLNKLWLSDEPYKNMNEFIKTVKKK